MPHFVCTKDETFENMEEITSDFTSLKMAVLEKATRISGQVKNVTIGPKSVQDDDSKENIENEQNSCNVKEDNTKASGDDKLQKISSRHGITFSIKKILLENELQRKEEVRKAIERRKQHMENSNKEMHEQMVIMRSILALERQFREEKELERLQAEEEKIAQQSEIRRKHEQQLQAQRHKERKERLEREAEERRKAEEREKLLEMIVPFYNSFQDKCRDIESLSRSCSDKNFEAAALSIQMEYQGLRQLMEVINERTRSGELTADDVKTAEKIVKRVEQLVDALKQVFDQVNEAYDREIESRKESLRQVELIALQEANLQNVCAVAPEVSQVDPLAETASLGLAQATEDRTDSTQPSCLPQTLAADAKVSYADYTDNACREIFNRYKNLLEMHKEECKDLNDSAELKKFRSECLKAITIPVNAISGVSAEHLKDKYDKLCHLLAGVAPPNVHKHPQGLTFSKNILAKKLVTQGETLVSSKPEAAFPIASIAVALWNDHPDFGQLLLAHFHRVCPFTVPYYPPRYEGQTNEDYYKSLGYNYSESGVVEKHDQYLKRISGVMRLYASLMITRQRMADAGKPHPFGLDNAWKWLAATLNVATQACLYDVSATLILDVLEVTGKYLWQAYPMQFPKMLSLIMNQFYPEIEKKGVSGGPLMRLNEFLKNCTSRGSIPSPQQELPRNFW